MRNTLRTAILLTGVACSAHSIADSNSSGKLLATGGVSTFEGAAGGGLTPWALIGSYATEDDVGATVFYTNVDIREYDLQTLGFALGFYDRFELSYARQNLGVSADIIQNTAGALIAGLTPVLGAASAPVAPSTSIGMDVVGAKVRLFGDAVYGQDTFLPQVALGVQYKKNRDFDAGISVPYLGGTGIPKLLGARDDSGVDAYLSATKVLLGVPMGKRLLVNYTARATKANAFGLLGFGRKVVNPLDGTLMSEDNSYELEHEGSLGLFLSEQVVIGAEIRTQSNRLRQQEVLGLLGAPNLAKEDTVHDFFIAYVPNKRWSLTLAAVDFGNLPFQEDSKAFYVSAQAAF